MKKIAYIVAVAVGVLGISVLGTLAATTKLISNKTVPSAATISCVAGAVNAREQALDTGIGVYTQAVNSAYSARAAALKTAWAGTTTSQINAAVRVAWTQFKAAMKTASSTWKGTRQGAWRQFANAAKACKAPASLTATDAAGQSSEAIGQ